MADKDYSKQVFPDHVDEGALVPDPAGRPRHWYHPSTDECFDCGPDYAPPAAAKPATAAADKAAADKAAADKAAADKAAAEQNTTKTA